MHLIYYSQYFIYLYFITFTSMVCIALKIDMFSVRTSTTLVSETDNAFL